MPRQACGYTWDKTVPGKHKHHSCAVIINQYTLDHTGKHICNCGDTHPK